jgi:hypothetical protein
MKLSTRIICGTSIEKDVCAGVVLPAVKNDIAVSPADLPPIRDLALEDVLELRHRQALDLILPIEVNGESIDCHRSFDYLRIPPFFNGCFLFLFYRPG